MNGIIERAKHLKRVPALVSLLITTVTIFLISFNTQSSSPEDKVRAIYMARLVEMKESLTQFKADLKDRKDSLWKNDFKICRESYKRAECFIAYSYPLIAKRLNGPPLMDVEPVDPNESIMPTGFQVMEEDLWDEDARHRVSPILKQVDHMLAYVHILQAQAKNLVLGRSELYDALRLNLCTMASLGLSGFDTPLSKTGIEEAVVTLNATRHILENSGEINAPINKAIDQCISYCKQTNVSFDQFDRARFMVNRLRPLFSVLYNQQVNRGVPFVNKKRAINTNAQNFFEVSAYDPYFFAPDSVGIAGKELIELGKALFSETSLSPSGRSCASCHNPEKAYTDGLKSNVSLQRDEHLPRNTPTIINASLQPVLFADSRVRYLEQQAHDVMLNKQEMNGSPDQTVKAIQASAKYIRLFARAFPDKTKSITHENVIVAIAAFERSLIRLNAPFDQYMRGDTTAMNQEQIQGFNLFMGKAKCGTCHFMPLFNGAVPPFYDRQDAEIIGVPTSNIKLNPSLDKDLGVYDLFHSELKRGAFKTPSVRNAAVTAPYMHNGIYKTLEEVIDFYDKGGGTGLGIDMQQQTLPAEKLNLKPPEKAALIAFIKALNDN